MIQQEIILSGQQIIELRLAKELTGSRTPIRQTLRLLEGEGFLQTSVGRPYILRQVDLREYLQSLKVRELLQSEAAFSPTEFVPNDKINVVWENLKLVERLRPYNILAHQKSDMEVHQFFISAHPNLVLGSKIRDLRVTTDLFEIANLSERLAPDSKQHEGILDAL